jgi:hypothetical protein
VDFEKFEIDSHKPVRVLTDVACESHRIGLYMVYISHDTDFSEDVNVWSCSKQQ